MARLHLVCVATRGLLGSWGWLGALSVMLVACGGEEPADTGPALVKFCHQFHRSGKDIDLTLQFGQPPAVMMTAATGSCSPALGQPCIDVPRGTLPVKLMEGEKVLVQTKIPVRGGESLAYPIVTGLGELAIRFVPLADGKHCDSTDLLPTSYSSARLEMPGTAGAP
jgi:hypothetical protein